MFECPTCKCYILTGPIVEGVYTYAFVQCSEGTPQYRNDMPIFSGQKIYLCAVEGSVTASNGVAINLTGQDCASVNVCDVPAAACYTVSLASGTSATFSYTVPVDGIGNTNMLEFASVSSMMSPTAKVCARVGSIIKTSGTGVLNISAPGWDCETTPFCNATCQCVTVTNDSVSGEILYYLYYDCNTGLSSGYLPLDEGLSVNICMLSEGFDAYNAPYITTDNGPCDGTSICEMLL